MRIIHKQVREMMVGVLLVRIVRESRDNMRKPWAFLNIVVLLPTCCRLDLVVRGFRSSCLSLHISLGLVRMQLLLYRLEPASR